MAVADDLNKLAAQEVVYLTRTFSSLDNVRASTEVLRGRLRQALNGDWVFNASTGENGVVGFVLGGIGQNAWASAESPAGGLQVTVTSTIPLGGLGGAVMTEVIVLTNVIPADFAD